MKSDLEKYIQAKEYVDTLMIPLLPISFSNDNQMKDQASQSEVLSILMNELERELHGRVLLTPSFFYLTSADQEKKINLLNEWIADAQEQPFKHVFLVTYDSSWKKDERALDGSLLWIPSVKSGDIHSEEMNNFIRDQVEQLVELIRTYW